MVEADFAFLHQLHDCERSELLRHRTDLKDCLGGDWCSVFQIRQSVALFADLGFPHYRRGQAGDALKSHLVFDVVAHIVCLDVDRARYGEKDEKNAQKRCDGAHGRVDEIALRKLGRPWSHSASISPNAKRLR
jgi:hypothetical protein